MSKKKHRLRLSLANKIEAHRWVDAAIERGLGIGKRPWFLTIEEPTRSLEQNDRLHAMLDDVAAQVEWHGAMRSPDAWKDIFTAAWRAQKHGLDFVPGIHGGPVLLGNHTSAMSVEEMSDLIDLIEAWSAQNGVTFREERAAA